MELPCRPQQPLQLQNLCAVLLRQGRLGTVRENCLPGATTEPNLLCRGHVLIDLYDCLKTQETAVLASLVQLDRNPALSEPGSVVFH